MSREAWIDSMTGTVTTIVAVDGGYSTRSGGAVLWDNYEDLDRDMANDDFVRVDGRIPWGTFGNEDDVEWYEVWLKGDKVRLVRKAGDRFDVCTSHDDVDATYATEEAAVQAVRDEGFAPATHPPRSFYGNGSSYAAFLDSTGASSGTGPA